MFSYWSGSASEAGKDPIQRIEQPNFSTEAQVFSTIGVSGSLQQLFGAFLE
jgi:hypothetical protein